MNDPVLELEEFYMSRLTELIDSEQFDDASCLHKEFVIDHQEPQGYLTLTYLSHL